MKVSDSVKKAYQGTGVTKYITLYFPELDISISTGDGRIYSESMSLSEKLVDSSSIEFVGCISSKFKIQINNIREDIKGKKIVVKIHTEGTKEEPVSLFKGIVDSAIKQSNKRIKEITAYDELYTRGNKDVSSWYKALKFPLTLKQIRDSLFNYIGIKQVSVKLPNDGIVISKQYDPNSLQALAVIKAICQINGVFGIINRNGEFEYRVLGIMDIEDDGLYTPFYPGEDAFPGISMSVLAKALEQDEVNTSGFAFYKDVRYEEFTVKPVDKLTIRQTEDDSGSSYGSGENNYIIQGNMFTYGLPGSVLTQIAENIYPNVRGFSYHPFTSQNNGLPYLECGVDAVSYTMIDWEAMEASGDLVYENKKFYVLNRELSGIQALRDSYGAEGEEYQTEFITDLQTQIDILKRDTPQNIDQKLEDYTYDKTTIDNMFENVSGGTANIVSVAVLPNNPDPNTLYLIQGEVIVE